MISATGAAVDEAGTEAAEKGEWFEAEGDV